MPTIAKELIIQEIAKEFEKNPYAFISTFESMPVADMSEFRRTMEKCSTRSLLVKHSFVKKVFAQRSLGDAERFLKGQVLVTFAAKDPQVASKALVAFAKSNKKVVPAGLVFEGKVYGEEFIKALSIMPSRHELLTQMVIRMKSPISGFVMTLNQVLRGFVVALNEIKKQKEGKTETV
ncbi:MAG: 50S ribosomal protein L10 [Candidatus Omnitrophota bacterium]|jgi:large subunit ribosomal protein L10